MNIYQIQVTFFFSPDEYTSGSNRFTITSMIAWISTGLSWFRAEQRSCIDIKRYFDVFDDSRRELKLNEQTIHCEQLCWNEVFMRNPRGCEYQVKSLFMEVLLRIRSPSLHCTSVYIVLMTIDPVISYLRRSSWKSTFSRCVGITSPVHS